MYKVLLPLLTTFVTNPAPSMPGHLPCIPGEVEPECANHPVGWFPTDSDMIFKILRPAEWIKLTQTGIFSGSNHDQRDGFIHLSTSSQLHRVIKKYFSDTEMYLVGFNAKDIEGDVIWESGYPHVYSAPLYLENVRGSFFYTTSNYRDHECASQLKKYHEESNNSH